jgi:hypothetical protein
MPLTDRSHQLMMDNDSNHLVIGCVSSNKHYTNKVFFNKAGKPPVIVTILAG